MFHFIAFLVFVPVRCRSSSATESTLRALGRNTRGTRIHFQTRIAPVSLRVKLDSFGGIVLLKLMEELASDETAAVDGEGERQGSGNLRGIQAKISGAVFLCSVPPSGNGPMTKRFIKEVRDVLRKVDVSS